MFYPATRKHAFTLVELSIVIVIIGLIVAGVTAGQGLVRQAGLRAVLSELDTYKTAINTFKLQYNALPGDLNNAYSYWGSACGASAGACNGSGNGIISQDDIGGRLESYLVWKHLLLAGMISGSYSGSSVISNAESTPGLNTPKSKMSKGEWGINYSDFWYSWAMDATLARAQRLMIGGHRPSSYNEGGLFSPSEASAIDTKIDDGRPYLGWTRGLLAQSGTTTTCVTGSGVSASYAVANSGIGCWMWMQF